ncbi:hypothetical protein FB565_000124 [Actinoplanes lutulentus]|uniref:Glycosyl transferase family 1 n=1 Tax=Actinoplanes lutulentus TaxID=1287878 RepID=A0A327YYG4_9ACTN|nr:glycosyltransferase [Actinoplanes lutulentus]MBB2940420.1 hypothetical protein [Actinoplanes lutulentus]RAK25847.1 glycosyl transferase family 1 [Actinoplanes lutulentus]
MIKDFVKSRLRSQEIRRRQIPAFAATGGTGDGAVYYLAPDNDSPSGGVRVIYRHVDLLNSLGIPAKVVHAADGFRCSWFPNTTPVVAAGRVSLGARDVLVVPEWYGPGLGGLPEGPRIVIFNQRAYDTYDLIPYEETGPGAPYAGIPGLAALLAVSDDNVDLLRYAFPGVPVHLTRNVIDPSVFHLGGPERPRRISFVGHRRSAEREQLLHILRSRGVLDGWDVVAIAGKTELETAEIMRNTAIFLSFSEREGFGLPPAEAMACGAYVVGYPGLAGREFFVPGLCSPVADQDLLAFARAVEQACIRYDKEPQTLIELGAAASARVLARYDTENLRTDLRTFYSTLL